MTRTPATQSTARATHKQSLKGFTLIELLVVIAIIGVLSTVVLASLGAARNRGNDAAVKSNLATLRPQAEIFSAQNGYSYAAGRGYVIFGSTFCPPAQLTNSSAAFNLMGDTTFFKAVEAARSASGGFCSYVMNPDYWAVSIQLKGQPYKSWCVDSFGKAGFVTNGNEGTGTTQLTNDATITSTGCVF